MSRVYSNIGTLDEASGRQYLKTAKSDTGCVVYGPYQRLGMGRYCVKFDIKPDECSDPNVVCCEIDVVTNTDKILERAFSARELRERGGEIEVEFEITKPGEAEYRVHATGTTGLRIAYDRIANVILDNTSNLSFLASGQDASEFASRVYQENFADISYFAQFGALFHVGDRVVATVDGIKFHIDCVEDVQVLNEVFFRNDYTFVAPRGCIAIDIGMNVGLASLALANNRNVEKVYAFEPFKAPYLRARQNFDLNPTLSVKIDARNYGLSDKQEDIEVLSEELQTIARSVRGSATGRLEKIQVREAGSELKGLIAGAKLQRLGVVLKVDCEGSEFPIFESLEREDLFKDVDAVMMEWHKFWSKDKTQDDLIRPLVKAGFLVFDQSNPSNLGAGFLLAVRTAHAA